jgi:hypothetical protein
MTRLNFYILLDLDTTVSDPAVITAAINARQAEWSRDRNHSKRGLEAQQNLALVPEIRRIMTSPADREAEARDADRIRAEAAAEARRELDEALAVLAAGGYLLEEEVAALVGQFGRRLSEAEVRGRVPVPVLKERPKAADKPTLERSVSAEITSRLERVGKKDLYDFLGLTRTASLKALLEAARRTQLEALNNNNKTAEVTATGELAGRCLTLFSSEDERRRYDNSLEQQRLYELDSLLEPAGASGRITPEVVEALLREALERGLELEDARQYIEAFALKRKWAIQVPAVSRWKDWQRCACGALLGPTEGHCGQCGLELSIACPRCTTATPAANRACAKCGFPVGDATVVRRLRQEAEKALARGEVDQALRYVDEALVYWPGATDLVTLRARIMQRRQEGDTLLRRLDEALVQQQVVAAEKLLEEFEKQAPGRAEAASRRKTIAERLKRAGECVARARQEEQAGRAEAAIAAYSEALRDCRDLRDALDGLARFPPPPPARAEARAEPHGIVLRWQPVAARQPLRYRIVRKVGSEPQTPEDGALVGEVLADTLTDATASPGEMYHYAVFSIRDGIPSAQPALAGPVLRTVEVGALRATVSDSCISLEWATAAGARGVEVWRQLGVPPRLRGEGVRIVAVSAASATDAGLENGRVYGYRVVAVYTGPGGQPIFSDGVTCTARVVAPPKPVTDLHVLHQGEHLEVAWTTPPTGQVCIYAARDPITATCGSRLAVQGLERLGHLLKATGPHSARLDIGARQVVHLLPVTIDGSAATAGAVVRISWVEDVDQINAVVQGGQLKVRWKWPRDVTAAVVAWRTDQPPTGPEDPQATRESCLLHEYERDGGFTHAAPTADRLYIAVYAALRDGAAWNYASALTPGSRAVIDVARRRTVTYRIDAQWSFWLRRTGEYALKLTPDGPTTLPALTLVAKPGGRPLSPEDGTAILRLAPGLKCGPEQPLTISFRPEIRGGRFRLWLFPVEDADFAWLDLVPVSPGGFWLG